MKCSNRIVAVTIFEEKRLMIW